MQTCKVFRGARCLSVTRRAVVSRRAFVARAQAETETQEAAADAPAAPRKSRNSASFTGFTTSDSYGQTNIFPVEVGTYEVGSNKDVNGDETANSVVAALAFGVAAVVLVGGGLLLTNQAPTTTAEPEDFSQYLAVSAYKAKFAAEFPAPVAAPAVLAPAAEGVAAPAVEEAAPAEVVA